MDGKRTLGLRLAQRDESALEAAYTLYAPSVLAYLQRYVGPDEAEDVLQRTFLDVWRKAGTYDPTRRFSGWLFTLAHHRAVDALRARRTQVVDVETFRDLIGEDGRDTQSRFADAAEVHAALQQLPEPERDTLVLAYFQGLNQREIADLRGVPLGTVKARASRGTHRLGAILRAAAEEGA